MNRQISALIMTIAATLIAFFGLSDPKSPDFIERETFLVLNRKVVAFN